MYLFFSAFALMISRQTLALSSSHALRVRSFGALAFSYFRLKFAQSHISYKKLTVRKGNKRTQKDTQKIQIIICTANSFLCTSPHRYAFQLNRNDERLKFCFIGSLLLPSVERQTASITNRSFWKTISFQFCALFWFFLFIFRFFSYDLLK